MDWSPEDTEVLQLLNRIRQVLSKQKGNAYQSFINACADDDGRKVLRFVNCFVDGFELRLQSGDWFVVYAVREEKRPVQVLDAKLVRGSLNYTWLPDVIRNEVVPALDRELVLDDLSRI